MSKLSFANPTGNLLDGFDDFVSRNITGLFNRLRAGVEEAQVGGINLPPGSPLDIAIRIPESFRETPLGKAFPFKPIQDIKAPSTVEETFDVALGAAGGLKTVGRTALRAGQPVITRIAQETPFGKKLADLIKNAASQGEVAAGKRTDDLLSTSLKKFNREENFNLFDVFEGRALPLNERISQTFATLRKITDDIAAEAQTLGIKVRRGAETVPFEPRENFFPRVIPNPDQLARGAIRADVSENIVRAGIRRTRAEADTFIDEFRSFMESGKRKESMIEHLVQSGQAKSPADALSKLQRFKKETIQRQGSLEFSREVDLPFFDPNPGRVLPKFITSSSKRLAEIQNFGQKEETINKLIKQIDEAGGDTDLVRAMVDRITKIQNTMSGGEQVSSFLRMLQGFKLGLAQIPNLTQGTLNTFLAGDMKAVGAGIAGLLNQQGRGFALRSGATLDATIQETLKSFGGSTGPLGVFLKATGFSATEKMNRILAANGGASYGQRLFNTLIKDPNNIAARRFLEEMGVKVDAALKRGALVEDDILTLANNFTNLTQFRARPQDLPFFASTPTGKVVFQFKNFIYGQTRLINRVLVEELKNKEFGRATRNLIILATIFPLTGEAISDVRALIKGRKRTVTGLARYFDNIAQVGAMGIFMEALQSGSFGRGTDFLAGPTAGDLGKLLDIAGQKDKTRAFAKELFSKIPLAGQILKARVFPPKNQKQPSGSRTKNFTF